MKERLKLLIENYREQLNELRALRSQERGDISKLMLKLQIDYLKLVIHDLEKLL